MTREQRAELFATCLRTVERENKTREQLKGEYRRLGGLINDRMGDPINKYPKPKLQHLVANRMFKLATGDNYLMI